MPIERHGGFHPQRVARAQAAFCNAELRARCQDLAPQTLGFPGSNVDFPAVFAGVAGAGDAGGGAGDGSVKEVVSLDGSEIGIRQLAEDEGRERALNRQLRVPRAGVFNGRLKTVVGDNMPVVFILIGRVDAQEVIIGGDFVDQDVVDKASVAVEQRRILLPVRQRVQSG